MTQWPDRHRARTAHASRTRSRRGGIAVVAAVAAVGLAAAGCGSGAGGSSTAKQTPASAKQTIVFATQGLGSEGTATQTAVKKFEAANPKIHVQILNLSPVSDVALQQLEQRFISGSGTPDVITSDVVWPATFARPGWLADLTKFHPNTSAFFPGQIASGTYNGKVYGIPWFINAEGLYYRTDLVKTPPTTVAQLVSEAKAAMAKDPSLKEGLAFEGDKYEGAVTAFQSMGGQLTPPALNNLNSSANVAALKFESDAIHTFKIAPQAVSTWEESQVQAAWQSGQTPFALNWPYIFSLSEASGSSLKGKTGWVPFPNAAGGTAQASLGGDDLVINAKSTHQPAAWKFIQYLISDSAQIDRAVAAGDPPAVKSAYNPALYAKAPFFRQEQAVFARATPRPVTPVYTQISAQLQTMISSVLSGQSSPSAALSATAPTVKQLQGTASG